MASLNYSPGALDSLRFFHRVTYVVFVEGHEDVPFWNEVFHSEVPSYHLKVAGGAEEVEKCIDAIVTHSADIAVARDLDMLDLLGATCDHPRVLYTYGYSIENTLCSADAISIILQHLSLLALDHSVIVQSWLDATVSAFQPLVELDIANRKLGLGVALPLTNYQRFAQSTTSAKASKRKIEDAVRTISQRVSKRAHKQAAQLLLTSTKPPITFLRGHFLMTAVSVFLREQVRVIRGKPISLSSEALYALLLGQFSLAKLPAAEATHFAMQVRRLLSAA